MTGKCYAFTQYERYCDQNCLVVRQVIGDYIKKRISGQIQSSLKSGSDILSLMLSSPDIFNEEDLIDEVIDMILAGTQTTQYSVQTALSHFMTDPESLKRARSEFHNLTSTNEAHDPAKNL